MDRAYSADYSAVLWKAIATASLDGHAMAGHFRVSRHAYGLLDGYSDASPSDADYDCYFFVRLANCVDLFVGAIFQNAESMFAPDIYELKIHNIIDRSVRIVFLHEIIP